jgi:hypothetical protein
LEYQTQTSNKVSKPRQNGAATNREETLKHSFIHSFIHPRQRYNCTNSYIDPHAETTASLVSFPILHERVRAPILPSRRRRHVFPARIHHGNPTMKLRFILLVPFSSLSLDPSAIASVITVSQTILKVNTHTNERVATITAKPPRAASPLPRRLSRTSSPTISPAPRTRTRRAGSALPIANRAWTFSFVSFAAPNSDDKDRTVTGATRQSSSVGQNTASIDEARCACRRPTR